MSTTVLKWILMPVLFAVTLFFGILPMKILGKLEEWNIDHESISLIVSQISAFSGGVFLAVCLLDLLPTSMKLYEEVLDQTEYSGGYPWLYFIAGLGFFAIYFLQKFIHQMFGIVDIGKDEKLPVRPQNRRMSMSATVTVVDNLKAPSDEEVAKTTLEYIKSITFLICMSLHVTLEGFVLGIQRNSVSFLSLFIGIMLHKAIVIFSVGLRLSNSVHSRKFVLLVIFALAILAPFFGAIGILIEMSEISADLKFAYPPVMAIDAFVVDTGTASLSKTIVTFFLTSCLIGVFMYVTFFEILLYERDTVMQRFLSLLGFFVIAVTMIFAH